VSRRALSGCCAMSSAGKSSRRIQVRREIMLTHSTFVENTSRLLPR
jgi:hypothetical protein